MLWTSVILIEDFCRTSLSKFPTIFSRFLKRDIRLHLSDRGTAAGLTLVSGGLRLVEVALVPSEVQRGAQTRQ